MPYVPFSQHSPKTTERERPAHGNHDDDSLPKGEYVFSELFYDECDCRRAFINVLHKDFPDSPLATFSTGWGSRSFYIRWFGSEDQDILDEMMGIGFPPLTHQCDYADRLLEIHKEMVVSDPGYEKPLRQHYSKFRKNLSRLSKLKGQ